MAYNHDALLSLQAISDAGFSSSHCFFPERLRQAKTDDALSDVSARNMGERFQIKNRDKSHLE